MIQVVTKIKEFPSASVIDDENYSIFCTLVRLQCVEGNELIPEWVLNEKKCKEALDIFTAVLGFHDESCVYDKFVDQIVRDGFLKSASFWNASSIEIKEMQVVIKGCKAHLGKNLDRLNLCLDLFIILAQRSTEIQVRDRLLQLVLYLLENAETTLNSNSHLSEISSVMLQELVFPSAVWKAGKIESNVRAIAIECILYLVTSTSKIDGFIGHVPLAFLYFEQTDNLPGVEGDGDDTILRKLLIPVLTNCMDEENVFVRQSTMRVVYALAKGEVFTSAQQFKLVYQELIKRFDDSQDVVRIQAANVLKSLVHAEQAWERTCLDSMDEGKGYKETRLDNVHWETMIKSLTVHMDDMNEEVQEACCEVLMSIARIAGELIKEHFESVGGRHRSQKFIERVVGAIFN